MTANKFSMFALVAGLAAANLAQADHNSLWGEGTANMPNDIHNTRIDTLDEDDSSFIDFVRMGSGADSDNRFLTDTETSVGGSGSAAGTSGRATNRGGRS